MTEEARSRRLVLLERVGASARARAGLGIALTGLMLVWTVPLIDDLGFGRWMGTMIAAVAFVGAGLVAARHRPENPIWALMIAFAVVGILGEARAENQIPWRYTVGIGFDGLAVAILAYLLLAFPTGRLGGWWPRLLTAAIFVVTWGWKPFELLWSPPGAICATCAPAGNLLFSAPGPFDVVRVDEALTRVAAILVGLVLASLLIRLVRSSAPRRRVLAPVLIPSVVLTAKLLADEFWLEQRFVVYPNDKFLLLTSINTLLFTTIPVGFLIGLFRTMVTRSALGELLVDLGRLPASGPLRDLLARAVGDPRLRLGFWAEPFERYVDSDGRPLDLPEEGAREALTFVTGEHGPLAVLVHDPALLEDEGLVETIGAAARLALENERLRAEVRAQLEEVSRSRARIVSAGDAQRRRIERDLHDGAQQRLVLLAMSLQLIEANVGAGPESEELRSLIAEAQGQANQAMDELRDLARGIHPPILTEEGLAPALESLADRAPVPVALGALPQERLDPEVEIAAYYVCSEAIVNTAKHADAKEVRIEAFVSDGRLCLEISDDGRGGATMDGGSGLVGLVDRVGAAGGHLAITSPPGAGTRISVQVPLGEAVQPPPSGRSATSLPFSTR